jgi:glycosyltransferase involved in cell wall biosynthesis
MYNAEDSILSTIKSVITQTTKDIMEILIINDGSTDQCVNVVKKYINQNNFNSTIRIIDKENGGVSSARNRGIIESKGNFIAFLDSDDIWSESKLEKQMEIFRKNKSVYVLGTNKNNDQYPYFGKNKLKLFDLNIKELIIKWHPHTSTILVRREVFDEIGFYNEKMSHAEDGEMLSRMIEKFNLYCLNENLVFTGSDKLSFGESGLSANLNKMYCGELKILALSKKKNWINFIEYIGLYLWLTIKYYRRIFIIKWKI